MSDHRKIFFDVIDSWSGVAVESMWARPTEEGFVLDNIPFYAGSVACEDVVRAEVKDGVLWFDGLVRAGGHSTVRLVFVQQADVAGVRARLRELRCQSELSDRAFLIAVDIPPDVAYADIRQFLEEGRANGVFDFEEACLAQ